jgi:hypothetical protein
LGIVVCTVTGKWFRVERKRIHEIGAALRLRNLPPPHNRGGSLIQPNAQMGLIDPYADIFVAISALGVAACIRFGERAKDADPDANRMARKLKVMPR